MRAARDVKPATVPDDLFNFFADFQPEPEPDDLFSLFESLDAA